MYWQLCCPSPNIHAEAAGVINGQEDKTLLFGSVCVCAAKSVWEGDSQRKICCVQQLACETLKLLKKAKSRQSSGQELKRHAPTNFQSKPSRLFSLLTDLTFCQHLRTQRKCCYNSKPCILRG